MNKDKRYIPTGTFYSYWASRKKRKEEGGWGRGISGHISLKNPRVIKNIFSNKTL